MPHGNTTGTHKRQSQVGRHMLISQQQESATTWQAMYTFNGKARHLAPVGIPN